MTTTKERIDTSLLDVRANEMGWELDAASPIEAQSYVNVRAISASEVRTYYWPKAKNGGKYDTSVAVFVYEDGSFAAFQKMDHSVRTSEAATHPKRTTVRRNR